MKLNQILVLWPPFSREAVVFPLGHGLGVSVPAVRVHSAAIGQVHCRAGTLVQCAAAGRIHVNASGQVQVEAKD